jgi:hypothetical protein
MARRRRLKRHFSASQDGEAAKCPLSAFAYPRRAVACSRARPRRHYQIELVELWVVTAAGRGRTTTKACDMHNGAVHARRAAAARATVGRRALRLRRHDRRDRP